MKTRYTYKYPRTSWDGLRERVMANKRIWWYSRAKAIQYIEDAMRPGYTSEPYMQLIQITDDAMTVLAECTESRWMGALEAAGFVSHPC